MQRRFRLALAATTLLALASALLVVFATAPATSAPQSETSAAADLGTNGAKAPRIDWGECPDSALTPDQRDDGYECATVKVPLSYQKPGGQKIELALGRLPAEDQEGKIGTLFYNPGGPGGSGRIPSAFSEELRQNFDIVGFDPRGTNASTPAKCFTSNDQALKTFGRPFPLGAQERGDYFAAIKRGTQLCDRNAGPILSHMSTANVARDMDLLRQSVGDERLTYLGYSYGTHLGEVYANLFPKKVRALTLDAVLDPVEWTTGESPLQGRSEPFTYRLGSFDGSQTALRTFLKACATSDACAFAEPDADAKELEAKYERLLQRLKEEPAVVPTPQGETEITYQTAVSTTLSALYSAQNAPLLADFLEGLDQVTGPGGERSTREAQEVEIPDTPIRPTFERPGSRQAAAQPYFGIEWFNAVSCLDTANPANPNLWFTNARKADQRAPGFGSVWVYNSTPCATWPVKDQNAYKGPWNRETANPILLVGNKLGDPATPYDDAKTTAERRLADGRLLTLNSYGHTAAFGGQSSCIDRAVETYLIEGDLPPKGKVCQPDQQPFDSAEDGLAPQSVPSEPTNPEF